MRQSLNYAKMEIQRDSLCNIRKTNGHSAKSVIQIYFLSNALELNGKCHTLKINGFITIFISIQAAKLKTLPSLWNLLSQLSLLCLETRAWDVATESMAKRDEGLWPIDKNRLYLSWETFRIRMITCMFCIHFTMVRLICARVATSRLNVVVTSTNHSALRTV